MFRARRKQWAKGPKSGKFAKGPNTRHVKQDTSAQESFGRWCELLHLPAPVKNYGYQRRKYPTNKRRQWRVDWAWPDIGLMVEIQGGVWIRGAHGHPLDILRNFEKQNDGALLGYRFLQVTPEQVRSGEAVALVEAFLGAWGQALVGGGRARAPAPPVEGDPVGAPLFAGIPGDPVAGGV